MSGIQLIVGLGNPGAQYETTRHNAGFWWVEQIASEYGIRFTSEAKFFGSAGRLKAPGHEAWLLKPATFMNGSGRAVAALANFYKIPPSAILVVHDELDLEPGTVRLKQGGGHGGHNGLKDIVSALGTPEFWRLRLGIGHPGERNEVVNFVLHPPTREESLLITDAMHSATAVLALLLTGQFEAAMLKLHTKK